MDVHPRSRLKFAARADICSFPSFIFLVLCLLGATQALAVSKNPAYGSTTQPIVIQLTLSDVVQPISADHIVRGIRHANQVNARAILLTIDTPGGLESSMREIIQTIIESRVPVITYVAPAGSRAASAGFFILLSGDIAAMAPGTHVGAAHPVMIGGGEMNKTMEAKIENDAAAYLRSICERRGRNSELAEAGVRQSKSYTESEALNGHLIDMIARNPNDIFAKFDNKPIKRFDGSTSILHMTGVNVESFPVTGRERFLSYLVDPNIAFLLGALGVLCLYIEFTHPGFVLPGVVGAISLVMALFAFHLLPINYAGVLLILLAIVLFALEASVTSHGVLASGGVVAMVIGSLILVDSPWPGVRIRLGTALAVTVPLAVITVILLRVALSAMRRKSLTGEEGMISSVGIAQTDINPEGRVLIRGEVWRARAAQNIMSGTRVRVIAIENLTLRVEPEAESR
jgi:membrane-bound serine protease (ClpP class)